MKVGFRQNGRNGGSGWLERAPGRETAVVNPRMMKDDCVHTPRPLSAKRKEEKYEREDLTRGSDPLAGEIEKIKITKKIEIAKKIKSKKTKRRERILHNLPLIIMIYRYY